MCSQLIFVAVDECINISCPVGAYCDSDSVSNDSCICPFVGPCDGNVLDVRLIGDNNSVEGRVEVLVDGMWGTVCTDFWDLDDAFVVCRQLGYPSVIAARTSSYYGEGSFPFVMGYVDCVGNESRLQDCLFDTHTTDCSLSDVAGVVCGKSSYRQFSLDCHQSCLY